MINHSNANHPTDKHLGTVTTDGGVDVFLTQQAFITGNGTTDWYQAHGVDADGNDYRVTWDCVDGYMEMDDESNCADWDKYEIEAI